MLPLNHNSIRFLHIPVSFPLTWAFPEKVPFPAAILFGVCAYSFTVPIINRRLNIESDTKTVNQYKTNNELFSQGTEENAHQSTTP